MAGRRRRVAKSPTTFFTVESVFLRRYYALFFFSEQGVRFLIRDRDRRFAAGAGKRSPTRRICAIWSGGAAA
jgi:hypothetical protein